jgi:hypothetical protein
MTDFFTPEEIGQEPKKQEETETVFFTPREKDVPFQEVIEGAPSAEDPDKLTDRILGGGTDNEPDSDLDSERDSFRDEIDELEDVAERTSREYEGLKDTSGAVKPASMGKLAAKVLDSVNSIICKWISKTDSSKPFKAEKDELKDLAEVLTIGFKQLQESGNWVENPWMGAVIVFGMIYTPMYANAFEIREQFKKMQGENDALKQQIKDLESQQFKTQLSEKLKDNYHKLGANRSRPSKAKTATAGKVETRGRKRGSTAKSKTDAKGKQTGDNLGGSA